MGNRYFQPGEERAKKVGELFAAIAPRYDLLNDIQSFGLHRVWKRRLVRLAAPQPGERALDVCCGTGDIAFELARASASVVGLDFSEPMLAVARARCEAHRSNKQNPIFFEGDAQQIPFEENQFEIVTVGYGLRNLASWEKGLAEMWRVAKPGGRLLILDFGKPENRFCRAIYFAYLRWALPAYGQIFCGDAQAYAYILASLKSYPAQSGVESKLRQMGCEGVTMLNLLGGVMSINYGEKPRRI